MVKTNTFSIWKQGTAGLQKRPPAIPHSPPFLSPTHLFTCPTRTYLSLSISLSSLLHSFLWLHNSQLFNPFVSHGFIFSISCLSLTICLYKKKTLVCLHSCPSSFPVYFTTSTPIPNPISMKKCPDLRKCCMTL